MVKQAKNTICLWYDGDAEGAARFYAETFPDSSVDAVHLAPGDYPWQFLQCCPADGDGGRTAESYRAAESNLTPELT